MAGFLAFLGALIGSVTGGLAVFVLHKPIGDGMEWIMDRLGI